VLVAQSARPGLSAFQIIPAPHLDGAVAERQRHREVPPSGARSRGSVSLPHDRETRLTGPSTGITFAEPRKSPPTGPSKPKRPRPAAGTRIRSTGPGQSSAL